MEAAVDEIAGASAGFLEAKGVVAVPALEARSVLELAVEVIALGLGGRGTASVAVSELGPCKAVGLVVVLAVATEAALKKKFLAMLSLREYHTHPTRCSYQTSIA